jgi:hypothetical protein
MGSMAVPRTWLPLASWTAIIVCFIAGTWGGRPSLLPIIPSLVVIYIVTAARARQHRGSN